MRGYVHRVVPRVFVPHRGIEMPYHDAALNAVSVFIAVYAAKPLVKAFGEAVLYEIELVVSSGYLNDVGLVSHVGPRCLDVVCARLGNLDGRGKAQQIAAQRIEPRGNPSHLGVIVGGDGDVRPPAAVIHDGKAKRLPVGPRIACLIGGVIQVGQAQIMPQLMRQRGGAVLDQGLTPVALRFAHGDVVARAYAVCDEGIILAK